MAARFTAILMVFFAFAGSPEACLAADAVFLACTLEKLQQTGGADVKEVFTIEPGFSIWPIGWLRRTKLMWVARPGWEGLETTVIEESDVLMSAEGHERIKMPLPSAIDACVAERARTAGNVQQDAALQDVIGSATCARQVELSKEPRQVLVTVLMDRVTGDLEVWHVQGDKRHSVVQRGHCELAHAKF
ncbi:MAG: hypothetical protein ACHQF3_03290 [Alphaproteobacteria bacterium]